MARFRETPPPAKPDAGNGETWRDYFDPDEPLPEDIAPGDEERAFAYRAARAHKRLRAVQNHREVHHDARRRTR